MKTAGPAFAVSLSLSVYAGPAAAGFAANEWYKLSVEISYGAKIL